MEIVGITPADAPDPRDEIRARVAGWSTPVYGLTPQPHLQFDGDLAIAVGSAGAGETERSVSLSYRYWRNPEHPDDPGNLLDLDAETRASLDSVSAWPRPRWMTDAVERMRYPVLIEAVRTSWTHDPGSRHDLPAQLRAHADHVLRNAFRRQLGLPAGPTDDQGWRVRPAAVDATATLRVDGNDLPAAQIDTDPFVYAVGATLADDLVVTVVVPRDRLGDLSLDLERVALD